MRKLAIALVLLSLSLLIVGASGCKCDGCPCDISWNEAIDHVGEKVKVCGTVVDTNYEPTVNGQPTFLSIGKAYPDSQRFTVLIWGSDRGNFESAPESYYQGKYITVTGRIEMYQGSAEIVVSKPSEICVKHTSQATPKATPTTTYTGLLPPPYYWTGTDEEWYDKWDGKTVTEQMRWMDENRPKATPTPKLVRTFEEAEALCEKYVIGWASLPDSEKLRNIEWYMYNKGLIP